MEDKTSFESMREKWGRLFFKKALNLPFVYAKKTVRLYLEYIADRETIHTTIPALEMAFANRKAQGGSALPFRPGGTVLRESLSGNAGGAVPHGSPEHEPQGELFRPSPAPNRFSRP
jgi:hypothetical protein